MCLAATWLTYGMTTLSVLPLLWRSRAPLTVLLSITAAGFLYLPMDGPGQPLPYSPLVAIFTVAAQAGVWQRRVMCGVGLPLVAVAVSLRTNTAREYLFFVLPLLDGVRAGRAIAHPAGLYGGR
ncbi:hypothetical protein GCM10020000_36010 [Streptomyces olivoverticillatus]